MKTIPPSISSQAAYNNNNGTTFKINAGMAVLMDTTMHFCASYKFLVARSITWAVDSQILSQSVFVLS